MLSKISQEQKGKNPMSHLYEESTVVKLIESERRMGVARDWGREK